MNTIEFAMKDDVPYAIDFLNPAPDFERDRITQFYFEMVVEKMARLVIDRALDEAVAYVWPRSAGIFGGIFLAVLIRSENAWVRTPLANGSTTAPAVGSSASHTPS